MGTVKILVLLSVVFPAFLLPNVASAQVSCPAGMEQVDDGSGVYTYISCRPLGEPTGPITRIRTTDSPDGAAGSVVTNSTNNTQQFPQNQPSPEVKECQQWGISNQFKCAGISIIILLASATVDITTNILDLSDYLFNRAIEVTILDFGTLYRSISGAAGQIWTVFRDLANILIIGLFVFIAISIILGLQEYGQKKLIARVIIIAILINFSFLFTLIAINTSNALATSIYNSALAPTVQSQNSTGISGAFENMLKTRTVRDTSTTLTNLWNAQNGGLGTVLMHTLISSIFQLGAAVVFLYGTFLLAARFIILIILLIVSSAAFASYLSPGMAEGGYGWSAWWHQLLRNSFFAPVLMIFLFASLQIATGITSGQSGSLGKLASVGGVADPTTIAVVLSYIIVLGFLLFGIIIANSIASGAARRLASSSLGSLLGGGAAIAAFGGRWTGGRVFAQRSHSKYDEAKGVNREIHAARLAGKDTTQLEAKYQKLLRQAQFADKQSKRTFDARNTIAGSLLKKTGAPGTLTEGTKKTYADIAHKAAEDAAKGASKTALSKSDIEAISKERVKQTQGEDAEQIHATATQEARDARRARDEAHQEATEARRASEQHEQSIRTAEAEKQRLESEHAAATTDAEKARLQTQINTVGERILAARRSAESARTRADNLQQRSQIRVKNAESAVKTAKTKLSDFKAEVGKVREEVEKSNTKLVGETARANVGNAFQRALYKATGMGDKFILHEAELAATSRAKIKDKAEARAAIDKYNQANDHGHAAPAAKGDDHGAAASGH